MAATSPTANAPRKVLFSAMKNEAPFVLEWVAYHKAIGFDEIVICSNPSNDGMEELLVALADAGEIRHLVATVPPDERPQLVASDTFRDEVGFRENDWYLWLDADEFLNVHVGDRTVQSLIDAINGRQFLLINWRIFGSAGHDRFPGRHIDQGFTRASEAGFAPNQQQKTLFRFDAAVHGFGRVGIHRPLLKPASGVSAKSVAVGSGGTADPAVRSNRIWLRGSDNPVNAFVSPAESGWTLAQINHYSVRTPEFFALKRLRGRGFVADAAGPANDRHTSWFFQKHDRNEVEDSSILQWAGRVTDEMDRLLQIPAVAEAKSFSDTCVQKLVLGLGARAARPGRRPAAAVVRPVPPPPSPPAPPQTDPPQTDLSQSGAAAAAPTAPEFALTFRAREAAMLRRCYARASVILEYGSGGSTVLAAGLGKKVISVESDKAWADRLSAHLRPFPAARVVHVDIGPTEKWGAPSRPRFHGRFHRYPLAVWDLPDLGDPDLVLIDGRFRVACMAAVLLRARRPTTVLVHDYVRRPEYHRVEVFARKEVTVGRLVRFTVTPGAIPPEMLTEAVGWFADPR